MDQEFPDEGAADKDQDLYPERVWARASAEGDSQVAMAGPPPTGDDRVDAAVAGLSRLPGLPPDEHVAVLEEAHGRLRDILGEVNEGQP
jgi:hypothetical protein